MNRLIPELDVSDLKRSLKFYQDILGCQLMYQRIDESFAMLDFEGAQIMLEEAAGPGRRFRTAPLEHPYGRGINFQIQTSNVDEIYKRCCENEFKIVLPIEEKWYSRDNTEVGNRQFVVADPDGYLLRLYADLGSRDFEKQ